MLVESIWNAGCVIIRAPENTKRVRLAGRPYLTIFLSFFPVTIWVWLACLIIITCIVAFHTPAKLHILASLHNCNHYFSFSQLRVLFWTKLIKSHTWAANINYTQAAKHIFNCYFSSFLLGCIFVQLMSLIFSAAKSKKILIRSRFSVRFWVNA